MARLAQRLREATAQRTLLSLPSPFQRLCALLLQLPQEPGPEGAEVAQIPTHQELAIMINASRETVTRVFQILFVRRVLVRDGNTLRLVQLQLLKDIAEGRADISKG
jgi:CRP-like cAMP-binding protein